MLELGDEILGAVFTTVDHRKCFKEKPINDR